MKVEVEVGMGIGGGGGGDVLTEVMYSSITGAQISISGVL